MSLCFCSFSSGSSGNCYLVRSETTAVLVDAGISLKRIREGLRATNTPEELVKGVLVTHEHSDHIKSLGALVGTRGLLRFPGESLPVYADEATWRGIEEEAYKGKKSCKMEIPVQKVIEPGSEFPIGDLKIRTFPLSHDSMGAMGYAVRSKGEKNAVTIVTDTGCITEPIRKEMRRTELLVLESNHDVNMLRIGPYPWFLKQRILSDCGHLSNDTAAETVVELLQDGCCPKEVALAHLSKENNFPEMAWQTMKNALEEAGYEPERDVRLCTFVRDTISELFCLEEND